MKSDGLRIWRFLPLAMLTLAGASLSLAAEPAPGAASTTSASSGAIGEALAFWIVAAAAGLSAIGCVVARSIVRMAMCLLGTLGAVALLYFLLHATFLGVIQLVVYAGGTLIVIVFGVMLTSRSYGPTLRPRRAEVLIGAVVGVALLAGLTGVLLQQHWTKGPGELKDPVLIADLTGDGHTVAELGSALLQTYLVPFELVSVLLLAVMIGAAYLAQPATPMGPKEEQTRQRVESNELVDT